MESWKEKETEKTIQSYSWLDSRLFNISSRSSSFASTIVVEDCTIVRLMALVLYKPVSVNLVSGRKKRRKIIYTQRWNWSWESRFEFWSNRRSHSTFHTHTSASWSSSSVSTWKYGCDDTGRNLYPVSTKNTYVAISLNISFSQAYWNDTVIFNKQTTIRVKYM